LVYIFGCKDTKKREKDKTILSVFFFRMVFIFGCFDFFTDDMWHISDILRIFAESTNQ